MKDNKIINLIEPSKKSPKESTKRKICIYEKLTRLPKNGDFKVKKKSCGFCNNTNHTANTCPKKNNIGQVLVGDVLVDLLQDACPFKVIEYYQCSNMFTDSLDFSKVQHLKWRQLLPTTSPCVNQRPDIDNLLLIITCFEKC